MDVIKELSKKGADKEYIAKKIIGLPAEIPRLFEGLNHDKGSIKFGCDKIIRLISEQKPKLIYPYFNELAKLLDSENNILKWGAIITLSNLVRVDSENKFEKIFKKYFSLITGKEMIPAANVIGNSWKIISAKPELTGKITKEILKSEKSHYKNKGKLSPECNNIVYGHAINSFDKFFDKIKNKKPVIDFVKRQVNNSRNATAKKADRFLKKY